MGTIDISKQLSHARLAAGEDLAALARRTGVRQENLRAIEDGRFAALPPGIYGRAAIKAFASAFGFDGAAILAECEALLTPVDEPIAALARVRGLRARPAEPPQSRDQPADDLAGDTAFPGWRHLAAAAIDACVIAGLLLAMIVAALTLLIVPVAALRDSGGAFAVMGLLLAGGYYVCFGGVRGATVGERALSIEPRRPGGPAVTLRMVAERALLAATEDVRCIERWGERLAEYAEIQRAKRSA
ncbi:MAG TPA: helix-turn-helix domain-containing protein [Vicinamibacterales bacterium]|nr:helix-turn-helix domain-containing protein [Vicinamibacterales bacterium]